MNARVGSSIYCLATVMDANLVTATQTVRLKKLNCYIADTCKRP